MSRHRSPSKGDKDKLSSLSKPSKTTRNNNTNNSKEALKNSLWEKIINSRLYGSRSENVLTNEKGNDSNELTDYENIMNFQERKKRYTTIFVGDGDTGQTSLITSIVNPGKEDKVKATVALEYSFARRAMGPSNDDLKRKSEGEKTLVSSTLAQVSDIWDLGGGREMSPLLSSCLTKDNLVSATLVIVLDLSNPLTCADSLLFWLTEINKISNVCMSKLSCSKEKQEKELFNILTTTYQYNKDRNVSVLPLSITVIGNKFDLFANSCSVACRRLVASYLRYICHFNHCNLVFTSVKDKAYGASFRYIGSQLLFSNTFTIADHIWNKLNEEESSEPNDVVSTLPLFAKDKYREFSIDKLICIGAGYDSIDLILNSIPGVIQADSIMPYKTSSYNDVSTSRGINSNIANAIKIWDEALETEFQDNLDAIEKKEKSL